jgi:hypothetical protein
MFCREFFPGHTKLKTLDKKNPKNYHFKTNFVLGKNSLCPKITRIYNIWTFSSKKNLAFIGFGESKILR